MVPPVDRNRNRPLRVRVASLRGSERREGQLAQREVSRIHQGLDALDDFLGITRRRQDAAKLRQFGVEAFHFLTELRQLPLRGETLRDLRIEIADLRVGGIDLLGDVARKGVVRAPDDGSGQYQPDNQADVPRFAF